MQFGATLRAFEIGDLNDDDIDEQFVALDDRPGVLTPVSVRAGGGGRTPLPGVSACLRRTEQAPTRRHPETFKERRP